MVITIGPYSPVSKPFNDHPGDSPHPGGSSYIDFQIRVLSRVDEVLIDFGEFQEQDLLSYSDSLSLEGASGNFCLKIKHNARNVELLRKLHPGAIVEIYAARNTSALEGVNRNPNQIQRIDDSPSNLLAQTPQAGDVAVFTPGTGSPNANTGFMQGFLGMKTQRDRYLLAVTAIAEGKANNAISQVDTAVAMGNRLQSGKWGKSIESVILAPGQFEATWRWGFNGVSDEASAIAALQRARGYGPAQAKQELDNFFRAVGDPSIVRNSVNHVKGATDYRGPAPNTVKKPGDYQRSADDNFYIPPGDRDASLSSAEGRRIQDIGLQAAGATGGAIATQPQPAASNLPVPEGLGALGDMPKIKEDPYLDACPFLVLRGVLTDYGKSTDPTGNSVLNLSGESFGKLLKDSFVILDLGSPDTGSQAFEVRSTTQTPQGVGLAWYNLLRNWVEKFWGFECGWQIRTRPIPFPPTTIVRVPEGSVWSALQSICMEGLYHVFCDASGAVVWEKLPWSSREQALLPGRNWEDLPSIDLPSWKILNWNARLSEQGICNFLRIVPVQASQIAGGPALAFNAGSIRQYGGARKRQIELPIAMSPDSYYTSPQLRTEKATTNTFADLAVLEMLRWNDRPVERAGATLMGDACWRIHTKLVVSENWSYKDAKPAEYYVSARSHTIYFNRGTWTTTVDLVRDRRYRYLGVGVGSTRVIDDSLYSPEAKAEQKAFTKFGVIPPDKVKPVKPLDKVDAVAQGVRLTPMTASDLAGAKEPPIEAIEYPPDLKVPLPADDYYWFDRFQGKIVRIGSDPIAWAKKFVIPKLGEETKPIEVKVPEANTGIASPNGPSAPFRPVDRIYTSNLYDPTPAPAANYDFTLSRGGSGFFSGDEVLTPVPCPISGTVIEAKVRSGYGNCVQIRGSDQITWLFAHLHSMSVRQGQKVTRGQTIGIQGFTGNIRPPSIDGTHCHVEIWDDKSNTKLPYSVTRPLIREYFRFCGGGKMPDVNGKTP